MDKAKTANWMDIGKVLLDQLVDNGRAGKIGRNKPSPIRRCNNNTMNAYQDRDSCDSSRTGWEREEGGDAISSERGVVRSGSTSYTQVILLKEHREQGVLPEHRVLAVRQATHDR